MKTEKLVASCFGHRVEVTLETSPERDEDYGYLPASILCLVAEKVECGERKGTFTNERLSGSWRVLDIDYSMIYRVLAWLYSFSADEALNKELFVRYYGERMGQHYFEKWCGYKGNLLGMLAYFHTNRAHGQLFCDMVAEQMNKYEKRIDNDKK